MLNFHRRLCLRTAIATAGIAAWLLVGGCGEQATLSIAAGTGPDPTLPAPRNTLLPTVNIAPARGWTDRTAPVAAAGLRVDAYARGLDHPRWLSVLPNGDVLVAETNAPAKPQELGDEVGDEARRCRRAEREPNHPAAR